VGQPKRPEIPVKDFAATLDLQPVLVLPFEPALYGSAANNAQMLPQMKAHSPTVDGIKKLAELVTGRATHSGGQKEAIPLLSFLKGRKRA